MYLLMFSYTWTCSSKLTFVCFVFLVWQWSLVYLGFFCDFSLFGFLCLFFYVFLWKWLSCTFYIFFIWQFLFVGCLCVCFIVICCFSAQWQVSCRLAYFFLCNSIVAIISFCSLAWLSSFFFFIFVFCNFLFLVSIVKLKFHLFEQVF